MDTARFNRPGLLIAILSLMLGISSPIPALAADAAPQSVETAERHPASSAPERALDAIIRLSDRDNGVFDFVIKAPWRTRTADSLYAPLFTPHLQDAWLRNEQALVAKNCGGKYIQGEICGMDYDPVTCAQDFSDNGYRYRTVLAGKTEAVIERTWAGRTDVPDVYRMKLLKRGWVLDGVYCTMGIGFNMTQDEAAHPTQTPPPRTRPAGSSPDR